MPKCSILVFACALALPAASLAQARQATDLAGTWELGFDRTGSRCRVLLRAEKSDRGDFFLGMPTACRHAMPGIAAVGRWSMPDDAHVVLGDPGGARLLTLDASGDGFASAGPTGTFTLARVADAGNADSTGATPAGAATPVPPAPDATPALLQRVATRRGRAEPAAAPAETREDLPGRYAVMREKRDTGCMITLDRSRATGGDRAQLAPGCRDQGIVIFDPSSWQLVKGELVLTARAGHKTHLEKQGEGQWVKDAKEGGKPLGLKRL